MHVFDVSVHWRDDSVDVFPGSPAYYCSCGWDFPPSTFTIWEKGSFGADDRRVFRMRDVGQHVNGKSSSVFPLNLVLNVL